jgi:hypothetical protein
MASAKERVQYANLQQHNVKQQNLLGEVHQQ